LRAARVVFLSHVPKNSEIGVADGGARDLEQKKTRDDSICKSSPRRDERPLRERQQQLISLKGGGRWFGTSMASSKKRQRVDPEKNETTH
jgi:hypothetical protein